MSEDSVLTKSLETDQLDRRKKKHEESVAAVQKKIERLKMTAKKTPDCESSPYSSTIRVLRSLT